MTLFVISLIALTLHRPAPLVKAVYLSAPLDPVLQVAVVEGESWFHPKAIHVNRDKRTGKVLSTDWGLFQLNSLHHPQFRDNLQAHIRYGGAFLARLELEAGGDKRKALHAYNGGDDYASYIMGILDRIKVAMVLDARYGGKG